MEVDSLDDSRDFNWVILGEPAVNFQGEYIYQNIKTNVEQKLKQQMYNKLYFNKFAKFATNKMTWRLYFDFDYNPHITGYHNSQQIPGKTSGALYQLLSLSFQTST